jgi:A/G-specific adenine glycosylase
LSLPELDRLLATAPAKIGSQAVVSALAEFGEVESFDALPPFVHAFTHYKLTVNPVRVSLSRSFMLASQSSYQWVPKKKLSSSGLPAPVRKLLDTL